MGTPPAAVKSLERILLDGHEVVAVYTQPDRPSGRGNKLTAPAVKDFALQNNLTVHQPTKIKTPEALEIFTAHAAELAVVVAYGRILPEGFLNAFPHGAINVHFSLLPKYRGAAPVNWAIVNGETKTGVTTMKMDVGLDTGDILLQEETPIAPEETAPKLMARLADLGADLLSDTLRRINDIHPTRQDHTKFFARADNEERRWRDRLVDDGGADKQPRPGFSTFSDRAHFLPGKAAYHLESQAGSFRC